MNLDWILSPVTPLAAIVLVLIASLACFVSAKREVYRLRRNGDETQTALARKLEQVQSAVAQIGEQKTEAPATPTARPSLRPSLNLTRRTQALRMRRRGESVESIAAALAAPRNEIELLLKVYEIVEYRKQIKAPAERAG
jgi:hypothetical protein